MFFKKIKKAKRKSGNDFFYRRLRFKRKIY